MMKLDDFKSKPQTLKLDKNETVISDENIDFLYRTIETILDRLLKKYESKVLRFLLEKYNAEMRGRHDPRKFHNDFDDEGFGDNSSTPF